MELSSISKGIFYLDANAFIYALEAHPEFVGQVTALFEVIAATGSTSVTSELTLAECLVKPFEKQDVGSQMQYEQHISPSEALLVIPVSRQILKDAAQLRAFFKNKLPDTIHLITALTSGCTYFVTNDDRIKFPPHITPIIISKLTP